MVFVFYFDCKFNNIYYIKKLITEKGVLMLVIFKIGRAYKTDRVLHFKADINCLKIKNIVNL